MSVHASQASGSPSSQRRWRYCHFVAFAGPPVHSRSSESCEPSETTIRLSGSLSATAKVALTVLSASIVGEHVVEVVGVPAQSSPHEDNPYPSAAPPALPKPSQRPLTTASETRTLTATSSHARCASASRLVIVRRCVRALLACCLSALCFPSIYTEHGCLGVAMGRDSAVPSVAVTEPSGSSVAAPRSC